MCGRGACTLSAERCCRIAGGSRVRGADRLRRRFNLGPQGYVPVVRCQGDGAGHSGAGNGCGSGTADLKAVDGAAEAVREVSVMQWGLVPAFAKRTEDYNVFRGGSSTFNARIESAESSGLWRRLLNSKRGVVLFDGFYEWKTTGKSKTPMFIRNRDDYNGHVICSKPGKVPDEVLLPEKQTSTQTTSAGDQDQMSGPQHAPLMLAALFDVWHGAKGSNSKTEEVEGVTGEPLESVTILTMEPEDTPMQEVHNRMPVFLTAETAALWLDLSQPFSKIVCTIVKASKMHAQKQLLLYEVSNLVSNIKNESPDCILSKKEVDANKFSSGLGRFFQKPTSSSQRKGPAAAPLAAAPLAAAPPARGLAACRPSSRAEEDAQLAAALAASLEEAGAKRPLEGATDSAAKTPRKS